MQKPAPFYHNIKKVKAIVLGADPSNSTNEGQTVKLKYVFGIESGDKRYFQQILKNLNQIGLTINDIYVQNLIQDYHKEDTSKNKAWEATAEIWLPILKKELDEFDPNRRIPVLITAERIMKFLFRKAVPEAGDVYSGAKPGIVDKENSKLERKLIPFYRHYQYSLEKVDYAIYHDCLKGIFNF